VVPRLRPPLNLPRLISALRGCGRVQLVTGGGYETPPYDSFMQCTRCKTEFNPTAGQIKKCWWYCAQCRSVANRESRERRRAAGTYAPAGHTKEYYHRADVRAKKTVRDRIRSRKRWEDPLERSKKLARRRLQRAVENGLITPLPCAECGEKRTEAHHPDYAKALEVVWLCVSCHRRVHGR